MAILQEQKASLLDKIESLKVDFEQRRDTDQEIQSDLRNQLARQADANQEAYQSLRDKAAAAERNLEDSNRMAEELRAQLFQKNLEVPSVSVTVHQSVVSSLEARIQAQEETITDLTRNATTLATRYKEGQLVLHV